MFRKIVVVLIIVAAAVLVFNYARRNWLGPFNPDRIAVSETRMWQAYYSQDTQALGREMVRLLQSQFGLSLADSIDVGRDLAGAAMQFQSLGGNYDQVLPRLERAYGRIKKITGGTWSPTEAAQAELDWWVARRTPGRDSSETVGRSIARLYAVLYGKTNPAIEQAGFLRAQAAELRDKGSANADWKQVERLLRQSYRALRRGVAL